MNFFEKLVAGLIAAGQIVGPVFIHSTRGIAILNASEEGLAAILEAHRQQQAQAQQAAPPAPQP